MKEKRNKTIQKLLYQIKNDKNEYDNNNNKLVISKSIKQLLINEFNNSDNKNKKGIGSNNSNKYQ